MLSQSLVILLAFSGLPAPSPQGTADFDWTQFGKQLQAKLPKEVKAASTLRQAHHVAEHVAGKLWVLGIAPNFDQAGRDHAQRRFHDSSLGTCGHTAQCLQQTWSGAGVPAKTMKTLVVLKRGRDGQIPQELNADHAAMVYLDPNGPIVFDLWADGRAQKTFANFPTSIWKGMPVAEWARRMTQEGYNFASCQEHPELGETAPVQLPELLRRLPFAASPGQ